MDVRRNGPLYSTRAEGPEASALLDAFVLGLAGCIDGLQDADAAGEVDELVRGAGSLAQQAAELGHDLLAAVALHVAEVARQGKTEDAHGALVELTDVAQRVRRGHRGAL